MKDENYFAQRLAVIISENLELFTAFNYILTAMELEGTEGYFIDQVKRTIMPAVQTGFNNRSYFMSNIPVELIEVLEQTMMVTILCAYVDLGFASKEKSVAFNNLCKKEFPAL